MAVREIATSDETAWCAERYEAIVANVNTFIQGSDSGVRLAVTCLCAQGHLLIEAVPGTGKTSLAKALAYSVQGASVRRIQFTPDLLPTDVYGANIYDMHKGEFEFYPGPVFANFVLGDEINRASPKTQSALLEVMEESQVTVAGETHGAPSPFLVLATQNPIESEGVYRLPEAQRDRFLAQLNLGYPDGAAEMRIVAERTQGHTPEQLNSVVSLNELVKMIDVAGRVFMAPAIMAYVVAIVAATRKSPDLRLGASPRASVSLAIACQAYAAGSGRHFVTAEDVKEMAPHVLCHRLIIRPEAELQGVTARDVLDNVLTAIPVPTDTRHRVPA